jgi:hypothetical protein
MRTLLALVLGLVLAGPAQAIPIDSGSISGVRPNDFVPMFNIQGEGLSISGFDIFGNSFASPVTGLKSLNSPIDLSNTTTIFSRASVEFNGQSFGSTLLTGSLTFDVEPFFAQVLPPSPNAPPGVPPSVQGESTFAMTGSLSFAGQSVGLEGIGTVEYVGTLFTPNTIDPFGVSFDFSPVPEPATLTLLGTVGGLGALLRWRKRRMARQHEGVSPE